MEPTESGTDETRETHSSSGNWLFPALLAAILLGLFVLMRIAPDRASPPPGPGTGAGAVADWTPSAPVEGETVRLTIDFGNGATKQFAALPWKAEMTVADVMMAARDFRPGISYTQQGTGEVGFLTSLEGLANEGASGRNWLYRVDDRLGHVSFCLQKIEPGMHILWTFTDELYNADSSTE